MKKLSYVMADLPVGTEFFVINGNWYGTIVAKDGVKYIQHQHGMSKAEPNDMGLLIIIKEYD